MAKTTPHVKTRDKAARVSALSSFGVSHERIANYMGIGLSTLKLHYYQELQESLVNVHGKVGEFLTYAATGEALIDGATHGECLRAAMFWAKTQMGFKETQAHEHSSPDGTMSPGSVDKSVVDSLLDKLVD